MAKSAASSPAAAVADSRVRHAVIAVFMQVVLTVVYSWSVFRGPLAVLHGWSKAQTNMPYAYALLGAAAGAIFGGLWHDRRGARVVASVGGLLMAVGSLVSAFAGNSLLILVIGYGVIAGFGGGMAYVVPIANLVQWFPEKRGMMVGLAVMGSGVSPLFWGPTIEAIIGHDPARYAQSLTETFLVMTAIFLVALVGAAQFLRVPPPGWKPAGWTPPPVEKRVREVPSKTMLGTWQFYALWVIFFLGTSIGLTAIGQASPLIHDMIGTSTPISAGFAVGIMGIFNGAGRLGWGTISDRIGRKPVLLAMSAVSVIACLGFLRTSSGFWDVLIGLCLAAFAYGGYLALMPSLTADYYGQSSIGGNYGMVFSAWGLCGFIMPGYFEGILDRTRAAGNLAAGYSEVYMKAAVLAIVVAVIVLFLRAPRTQAVQTKESNAS